MRGFKALWFKISVSTLAMKIFAKATAILVPVAVPCICKYFFSVSWKEFSAKISLSALCSSHVGIGGSFLWNALYALHTMFIPSSCGIFATSIETRIVFSGTFVFSKKLMKWVVSLKYDFCCCAIGWTSLSTNDDSLSVGPSHPDTIGLPTGVGMCVFV